MHTVWVSPQDCYCPKALRESLHHPSKRLVPNAAVSNPEDLVQTIFVAKAPPDCPRPFVLCDGYRAWYHANKAAWAFIPVTVIDGPPVNLHRNSKAMVRSVLWAIRPHTCCYCHTPLLLDKPDRMPLAIYRQYAQPTIEHRRPKSLGGSSSVPNLALSCQTCNVQHSNHVPWMPSPEALRAARQRTHAWIRDGWIDPASDLDRPFAEHLGSA